MFAASKSGSAESPDPYFEYVTLLLPGNGTNGAQNNTFIDSSANAYTITRSGNTTQGTNSPYGNNWSNYFDGTGDYLSVPDSSAWVLTGDFTIEAWIYPNVGAIDQRVVAHWPGSGGAINQAFAFGLNTSNCVTFTYGLGTSNINVVGTSAAATVGNWNHIAVTRSGTTVRLFVNGVQDSVTATVSGSLNNSTGALLIGCLNTTSGLFVNGYISNLRIVNGTAVYTSAFTPPLGPLTAITNTSLLTCQSNRFIDNSTNAFAVTKVADVSVRRFSPFAPSYSYNSSQDGGSGYFDGNADFLSAPSAAGALSTGNFAVESWININSNSALQIIVDARGIASLVAWQLYTTATGKLEARYGASVITGATTIPSNAWTHVAFVRSGSTITLYVNGVADGSVTSTANLSGGATFYVGRTFDSPGTLYFNGYMSDLRIVIGSAVYTSAFTPPTAPLTAITNTRLLLNFTNAAIIDNAEMSNLETVGNAQISTAQSKFGGGSIFGASGGYLLTPPTNDLEFGGNNFTIELWWYPVSIDRQALYHGSFGTDWSIGIDYSPVSSNQKIGIWASSNGTSWNLINADGGGNGIGTISLIQNAWNHIAYVRSGNTWMLFVNGVKDLNLTGISGSIVNRATSRKGIGVWWTSATTPGPQSGYIDDFRATKGYARYTNNFDLPSAPFPTR